MNNIKDAFQKAGGKIPNGAGMSGKAASAGKLVLALGTLAACAYGASQSVIVVQPGHIGLIYDRFGGLNDRKFCHEGMNIIIPWFQRGIIFNVRTKPQLINSQSGSKDLQMVQISLRCLVKPDPNNLPFIYRRLGKDYEERVLPSIVNETSKAVVAQFNAAELLTKRELVSKKIRDELTARAAEFHIIIEDVSITHLAFSNEYTAAVEAKQVAQQDAERAKYVVDKAIQEKKKIVIRAEGEAKSAELIGHAIKNNPAFIQLRRIEAAKEISSVMATSENQIYLNADTLQLNQLANTSGQEMKSVPTSKSGW
jgi:prohibitin 2